MCFFSAAGNTLIAILHTCVNLSVSSIWNFDSDMCSCRTFVH